MAGSYAVKPLVFETDVNTSMILHNVMLIFAFSSHTQGPDRLTLTWRLGPGIYSHVDIKEEGKENAFSLGKTLYIGNEEFEDLDEIIGKF